MKKVIPVLVLAICVLWMCEGPAGPSGEDGISITWQGSLENPPENPMTNWAYYNTTDGIAYIWDGDSWEILAMDGSAEKLIRLTFIDNGWVTTDSGYLPDYYSILKFNTANYKNISKITFGAFLRTGNSTNKCTAELYNLTDSLAIEDSQIESYDTTYTFYESEDVLANLPQKEITLSFWIQTETEGIRATAYHPQVFIYLK